MERWVERWERRGGRGEVAGGRVRQTRERWRKVRLTRGGRYRDNDRDHHRNTVTRFLF
jgi:hypothetical protein